MSSIPVLEDEELQRLLNECPTSSDSDSEEEMNYSADNIANGNKCVQFKLVRKPEDIRDDTIIFKPEMCHQIFGDKEQVFGFKNLKIKLYYTAAWLEIYVGVEYTDKVDEVGPEDIKRTITVAYRRGLIENLDEFERKIENDKTFKPFGNLVTRITVRSVETDVTQNFELYHCDCTTPGFNDFYKRLETFVIWFIDAASFIEFDDPNWNFFVLYEKYKNEDDSESYASAGYYSVYNYYAFPNNIRPRISQALILPPFQHKGIGSKMLEAVYEFYSRRNDVLDFTVEDPSCTFQRVRDFVDCQRIEKSNYFSKILVRREIPKCLIDKMHKEHKINKKQAYRICEILRLKYLDHKNPEEVTAYRLDIKKRLNRPFQQKKPVNRTVVVPKENDENISEQERKEKLNEMYDDLMTDYNLVIDRLNLMSCFKYICTSKC